jgi:cytochrome P450
MNKSDISATLLLDPKVIDDPYPFYRQLREEAPVWEVPGAGIFTVSTFELVAEATARVEDFSSHMRCLMYRDDAGLPCRFPMGPIDGIQVLATADPPVHPLHRSTVFPELVARRMKALEPDIIEIANGCLTHAFESDVVEFMTMIGNIVPITIISRLIGFRDSDLDQLLQAAFDGSTVLSATLGLDQLTDLLGRSGDIQKFITAQIASAMNEMSEDLLGTVARGVQDGVFDEFGAVIMLQTLLGAGGESTTSLLGNAVRILAERPQLQQQLRQNPDQIPTLVEEALRYEPPFRYHMRYTYNDTTLGGVDIPAESTVLLLWGAANRDDVEFERPDEIDLDRAVPRHHVSFGRGIHHCVGAPLARVEAVGVLTALLERTSSFTLDPNRAPRWVDSLMTRRHEELPLLLTAR